VPLVSSVLPPQQGSIRLRLHDLRLVLRSRHCVPPPHLFHLHEGCYCSWTALGVAVRCTPTVGVDWRLASQSCVRVSVRRSPTRAAPHVGQQRPENGVGCPLQVAGTEKTSARKGTVYRNSVPALWSHGPRTWAAGILSPLQGRCVIVHGTARRFVSAVPRLSGRGRSGRHKSAGGTDGFSGRE